MLLLVLVYISYKNSLFIFGIFSDNNSFLTVKISIWSSLFLFIDGNYLLQFHSNQALVELYVQYSCAILPNVMYVPIE